MYACKNSPELTRRIEEETSVRWYTEASKGFEYLYFCLATGSVIGCGDDREYVTEDEFITTIQKEFPPKVEELEHKYKIGDKVRIVAASPHHRFGKGEIVQLFEYDSRCEQWSGRDYEGYYQWLDSYDIEPYNDTAPVVTHDNLKGTFSIDGGEVDLKWFVNTKYKIEDITQSSSLNDALEKRRSQASYQLVPTDPIWEVL